MKKILLLTAIAVFGFTSMNAQDDFADKAKNGSFYLGANVGFPFSTAGDITSFNFGFDGAYLFEVVDNLEIGGLLGYTHFIADGDYRYYDWNDGDYFVQNYKDASFIPIAASARYYFGNHKFFGGLDLGVGINVSGDAKTGFYARPKFGFDLGTIALIASFQSISGGVDYGDTYTGGTYVSGSGFNSFNFGVEFGF
ncbi:hypothetical protein OS188_05045 [Xanthomarina sp. F1114]|uniref:hypothetical protein n=1 Tax=Xanthomarina sp. F1114 TaxID=2996019 RepID=UPI00225DF394|nr:hypothetical protein [Xanthomarina sp. F1114]MCX7547316.1 hypothetical protein [Xanthomarina sp. F1114]